MFAVGAKFVSFAELSEKMKDVPIRACRKRKLIARDNNNINSAKSCVIENAELGKFCRLISSIKVGDKLSDDHISAASQLLHAQFPDIRTPVLGQKLISTRCRDSQGLHTFRCCALGLTTG